MKMTLYSNLCHALLLACISVCLLPKVTAILPICFDANEEYTDCGSSCPAICGEPKSEACTFQCVRGCFCKAGFIRSKSGGCIPEIVCALRPPSLPTPPSLPIPPGKCFDINEQYTDCGTDCPAICDKPRPEVCTFRCVSGCFCKPDFIRSTTGGPCIPEIFCQHSPLGPPTPPSPPSPPGRCGINEEYTDGSACPPICDEPPPEACIAVVVTGCFCKTGFIRRTRGGECIPESFCRNRPGKCFDINEQYKDCGTACPAICDNPRPGICTLQCVPGCFCKPGFIRSTTGGPCIPESFCQRSPLGPPAPPSLPSPPAICGINEEYTDGGACPPICDEPPPEACILVLVTGCFCKKGFIRRTRGGECIPEIFCRNRPGRCPANEKYQKCGTACPPTCHKPNPGVCIDLCKEGCFCKSGFIRRTNGGPCIPKHHCPRKHGRCHHLNEEYKECGSACPTICDPILGPVYRNCGAVCVRGCFCRNGFIRTKEGSCIPQSLCGHRTEDFCPPKSNIICIRAINKCCSSADCPNRQLCCSENCGNTCKNPFNHKTNGTKVIYDVNCRIDAS